MRPKTWWPYSAFMALLAGMVLSAWHDGVGLWTSLVLGICMGYFSTEAMKAAVRATERQEASA